MQVEQRDNFRVEWNTAGKIAVNGRVICACIVSNLSNGGAYISEIDDAMIPDSFVLHIFEHKTPRACRVAWRRKNAVGVQFTNRAKSSRRRKTCKN